VSGSTPPPSPSPSSGLRVFSTRTPFQPPTKDDLLPIVYSQPRAPRFQSLQWVLLTYARASRGTTRARANRGCQSNPQTTKNLLTSRRILKSRIHPASDRRATSPWRADRATRGYRRSRAEKATSLPLQLTHDRNCLAKAGHLFLDVISAPPHLLRIKSHAHNSVTAETNQPTQSTEA